MKKLLLLITLALFSFCYATAGVSFTSLMSDSTQTKKGTKKVELKINDASAAKKVGSKKTETKKATPQKLKQTEKSDNKESKEKTTSKESLASPTSGTPKSNAEKSVSIEELKASAKKDTKAKSLKKTNNTPTVSYPYYTGGNIAIREFIRKHQRYPEECKSERLRGRVEVTMTISWDGTPHSPKITKSSGNEYMDAEAMRIAEMMPGWNPAAESDSPQDIQYTIFVNFRPGR